MVVVVVVVASGSRRRHRRYLSLLDSWGKAGYGITAHARTPTVCLTEVTHGLIQGAVHIPRRQTDGPFNSFGA